MLTDQHIATILLGAPFIILSAIRLVGLSLVFPARVRTGRVVARDQGER